MGSALFPQGHAWRPGRAGLAALVCLATIASGQAWARREKTVFLTPTGEWSPRVDEDGKAPVLAFQPAWTWSGFRAPLAGDPVLCAGSIAAASRDGEIVALDPASGDALWRTVLEEPLGVGPASDGTVLFQASARGRLVALEGKDGSAAWTTDLPGEPVAAPRVIGSRVVVGTADGSLLSIETAGGRVAARRLLPGRLAIPAEPAPGAILVGTDHGAILALRDGDLEERFRHDARAAITTPPVFDDDRVFFAAADRTVRCLRFRSGRERWAARTGAVCTARPVVRGPYLYVLCYDNDVYVFNKRNGHQLTRVRLGHRLDADAGVADRHLLVVPFTEASVISLAFPGLQKAGRFALEVPGEWFTTAPLLVGARVALGYGRSEGRILALQVSEQAADDGGTDQAPPGTAPPDGKGPEPGTEGGAPPAP